MSSHPKSIRLIDGKYRVLAQLGQGGTADVSLAVARGPKGFSKLVVLKSMRAQFATEADFAEMFMIEARLAARLNHPNVVQTNEVFDYDGLPVIVMEYLEGQPLSTVLMKKREGFEFPKEMHYRVLSEVLAGLHYSHELTEFDGQPLGVVHRDVSPHNVFITYDGQVKVLDFGIAKLNSSKVETATGVIKGKLTYMPAEQITGEGVDRRADVYAVGVMLWEAATGKKMWATLTEANIMNAVLNGDVPTPSSVTPVDPPLEAIIMKALASEADDRYETALAFQNALDDYLGTLGSHLRDRDIGKVISAMFKEVRAEHQRIVAEQLSKVAALSDVDYREFQPIELAGFGSTVTGTTRTRGPASQSEESSSRLGYGLVMGAVLAAAGIAAFFFLRPTPTTPAPTATAVSEVRLHVTAFPASATLYLDGERLPTNPFSKTLRKEPTKTATLVAKAEGFADETRILRLDEDLDTVITLRALPAAPGPSVLPKGEHGTKKTPRPSTVKPPVQVNCDPPYTIDARGVKKFKPACL